MTTKATTIDTKQKRKKRNSHWKHLQIAQLSWDDTEPF